MDGFPHRWTHKDCGGTAFYSRVLPDADASASSADFRMPDGTQPAAQSEIICGSCHKSIGPNPGAKVFIEPYQGAA